MNRKNLRAALFPAPATIAAVGIEIASMVKNVARPRMDMFAGLSENFTRRRIL